MNSSGQWKLTIKSKIRNVFCALLVMLLIPLVLTIKPRVSYALSCCSNVTNCICIVAWHEATRELIQQQHEQTREHMSDEWENHRNDYMIDWFWNTKLAPALQMMTEQLVTVAMQQMMILGAFIDAEEQLETQRLIQDMTARAHKDYHPSLGMCEIGTATKSLASAKRQATLSSHTLARRLMDRELASATETTIAENRDNDKKSRVVQFINRYCDVKDNNNTLDLLCDVSAAAAHRNLDINYTTLIDLPKTVRFNTEDTAEGGPLDNHDEEIFAMSANLYASNIPNPFTESFFKEEPDIEQDGVDKALILDARSIAAKRSVAQNSYNAIVGMKANGRENAEEVKMNLDNVLKQFGITNADQLNIYLGERPSYHSQMEILTKTLYQRPEFYTNLYDKPANVDRTAAAIQAISLMQNMDHYNSQLRSEMLLSVLLETKLLEETTATTHISIQNRINKITE